MEAETVFETSDYNTILTRLIAQEDFISFSRRENFKSYWVKGLITLKQFRCCKSLESYSMLYFKRVNYD
jgi:hypothetical protein